MPVSLGCFRAIFAVAVGGLGCLPTCEINCASGSTFMSNPLFPKAKTFITLKYLVAGMAALIDILLKRALLIHTLFIPHPLCFPMRTLFNTKTTGHLHPSPSSAIQYNQPTPKLNT
ncbi:uncharacterized protein K452DRAFT_292115, partial [Aplosporella prunicola CBS 121167]